MNNCNIVVFLVFMFIYKYLLKIIFFSFFFMNFVVVILMWIKNIINVFLLYEE